MLVFWYHKFRNIILYALIGCFCASLDFCIYSVLARSFADSYLWANIISTNVGIMMSFALNRSLNFKVKDRAPLRFISFYLIGLLGLGISSMILFIAVDKAGWDKEVSKLITIGIVAFVQFSLNKFITFRTHKDER